MKFYCDEEMAIAPEQPRIKISEGCHWNDGIATPMYVGKVLNTVFLGIKKTNDRINGFYGDKPWSNKEWLLVHLLTSLVKYFSKNSLGIFWRTLPKQA